MISGLPAAAISISFKDSHACVGRIKNVSQMSICCRTWVPSAASGRLVGNNLVRIRETVRHFVATGGIDMTSPRLCSGRGTELIHTDPPTTTKLGSPTADQSHQQVHRILKSATFRNAATLQQLLQFLTARAFEGGAEDLKEYTIGVEAFGRPQDFDPKTDTIVRVQIHRLRQKLTEYYDADGSRDPVLVEIPKGHYLPRFEAVRYSGKDNERDSSLETGTSVSAAKPFAGLNTEDVGMGVGRKKGRLGWFLLSRTAIAAAAVTFIWVADFNQ